MEKDVVVSLESQSRIADPLSDFLREKAALLLQAAIEAECQELLSRYAGVSDLQGRRGVVRNGYLPEREIVTGLGPVAVKVPRVEIGLARAFGSDHAWRRCMCGARHRSMRCCHGCTSEGLRRPMSERHWQRCSVRRWQICRVV